MFLKSENGGTIFFGIVTTNSFKNSQAIMQGMSEYMDVGFVPGNQFSIHPDFF
jgi:hypothetical protein